MLSLVDTSCWIELLRSSGRRDTQQRLGGLLLTQEAAWCDIVLLELWNGGGAEDRAKIAALEKFVVKLPIDGDVWRMSHELSRLSRDDGLTCPVADILITACAVRHGIAVESQDTHLIGSPCSRGLVRSRALLRIPTCHGLLKIVVPNVPPKVNRC